ncbi:hypothetical protein [Candidatus Nitrospira bockiana]
MNQESKADDATLSHVPRGLGAETGLSGSIPAVRVWGIVSFERSYSGNEASGINEAFTDIEPFLTPQGELDARARIRATKFNYIRESKFRELIRKAIEPYLEEVATKSPQTTDESSQPEQNATASADTISQQSQSYKGTADSVFNQILQPVVPPDKAGNYKAFFKALLVKMAACSPATPCGACPACIAEGSAATTQSVGVSLPHNWEKKFKETDFRTFRTVKSAAKDLMINVDGQTVEPSLTEALVRNRTPRTGDPDTADTVENTAQSGQVALGGMMILREHMFKGLGYVKTTLFNPTQLELGMLAYEHLVEDIRRGAKTSSGAGVWSIAFQNNSGKWTIDKNGGGEPMLVVDEILSLEGFTIRPPLASTPVDVTEDADGIKKCFDEPLAGNNKNVRERFGANCQAIKDDEQQEAVLIRYRGTQAIDRLRTYLSSLKPLNSPNNNAKQQVFQDLASFAASVIAHLIRPKRAIANIMEEFETARQAAARPSEGTQAAAAKSGITTDQQRGGRKRGQRGR